MDEQKLLPANASPESKPKPAQADDETSPYFIPDSATLRFVALHMAADADSEAGVAGLLARGQDRAVAKSRLQLFSKLIRTCLTVSAAVDAGEWPPHEKGDPPPEEKLIIIPEGVS